MDKLYDDLLVELECPICMSYMSPPIRQCETGHSICESCRKRLPKCPLCQGAFTNSKNLTLEALACKMHYPCINASNGCQERLKLNEKEAHELKCAYLQYKCHDPRCDWSGSYDGIVEHWSHKKTMNRPYRDTNVCHTKIERNDKTYVNLIKAHDELFWYKFHLSGGKLYWTVQYIGPSEHAADYYFEIEIFKPGQPLRKTIMIEYCQPVKMDHKQLFTAGNSVMSTIDCVSHYFGDEDQLLIYYLRVKEVEKIGVQRSRDQSTSRDSVTSEPAHYSNSYQPGSGRGAKNRKNDFRKHPHSNPHQKRHYPPKNSN